MEMATRGGRGQVGVGGGALNGSFSERRRDNLKENEGEESRGGDVGVGEGRRIWGHQVCCFVGGGGREHWRGQR